MEGLTITIPTLENKNQLVDYLLVHFKDQEPITRSLQLTDQDANAFFSDIVNEGMEYPVSFVVFNEKNEIVGCRLNTIYDKNEKDHDTAAAAEYALGPRHIARLLKTLLDGFENLLPDFNKAMQFVTVSVHPNYQRRGIAQKLVELSMRKAAEFQCDFIIVTATAVRSQKLFEKLGFRTVKQIKYTEFLDESGRQVFNCDDGTESAKLMVKDLRQSETNSASSTC